MNTKDQAEYKKLKTLQERASYLLKFKIEARTNIVDLNLVTQAFIGKVSLPITGDDEDEVVAKARLWLEEKAAA